MQDLWQRLEQLGQLDGIWWYSPLPWWYRLGYIVATVLALSTYLLMLITLVRYKQRYTPSEMFGWLLIASLPVVLVVPSLSLGMAPLSTLRYVGFPDLSNPQLLSYALTRQIGRVFGLGALFGLVGSVLALGLLLAGWRRPIALPAPAISEALYTNVQQITRKMQVTRRFEPNGGRRPGMQAPHGIVKVTRGERKDTVFSIEPEALIGKLNAELRMTDEVVSRRHARFQIIDGSAHIIDLGSTNKTYVIRGSRMYTVPDEQPLPLRHGDKIYLGHPDEEQSVEMEFQHQAHEGQDQ